MSEKTSPKIIIKKKNKLKGLLLYSVFGDRKIGRRLWPPRSPDLKPCNFRIRGILKGKALGNNPGTKCQDYYQALYPLLQQYR